MELIYFPAFLVLAAGLVIWLFRRGKEEDRSYRSSRRSRGSSARSADNRPRVQGNKARLQSGQGSESPGDIWRRKRERATKASFAAPPTTGVYQATYAQPESDRRDRNLADQEVNEAEMLGLDEYFSKQEAEKARKAAEQEAREESAGLSMTAMKYEPETEAPETEEPSIGQGGRKSGGFKP